MTQNLERAKSRLANIRAITPLLSALRTMSMSAWQVANRKIAYLKEFEKNYHRILSDISPFITSKSYARQAPIEKPVTAVETVFLIIGSERGLCGKFNALLAEKALAFIEKERPTSYQIWVMGARLLRELERAKAHISWRRHLPATSLMPYQECYTLTQSFLEQFEAFEFNHFIILYNRLGKGGIHHFSNYQLLPYEVHPLTDPGIKLSDQWPPPIIDTDPKGIYNQIIQHFIATSFYQTLLHSGAAEHSARYNLMQEATENAEEIIDELDRVIMAERKRQITQEMQELAMGAGLLEHH